MAKYRVELDHDLNDELTFLFAGIGEEGYIVKHLIGFFDGKVRAEVRADEHPPPHFHIKYDGEDASYEIETGLRLPNIHGLEHYDKRIFRWWQRNRLKIVEKWNSSRPSDCPVGPMEVPAHWG